MKRLIILLLFLCSCHKWQVSRETETVQQIVPKEINVLLSDSVKVKGSMLKISAIDVCVNDSGKAELPEQTFTQGKTTASVSIKDGKLTLNVHTADSGFRFDRTVKVLYNDTNTVTKTTVTAVKEASWWDNLRYVFTCIVITGAIVLCYTLYKRSQV